MIDKPIPNLQFPLPKRCVREGAIALDEVLKDIEVPSLDVPDLDASFTPSRTKDLFAERAVPRGKMCNRPRLAATSPLIRCAFPTATRLLALSPFGKSRFMAGLSPTSKATPIWSGNSPWV